MLVAQVEEVIDRMSGGGGEKIASLVGDEEHALEHCSGVCTGAFIGIAGEAV